VEGRVPDFIYRGYDSFHLAPVRRIYWPAHDLEKMKREVGRILPAKDGAPGGEWEGPRREASWEKGAEE